MASVKVPLELWPPTATALGAVALFEGKSKYGRLNWRAAPVQASVYVGAAKRHLDEWFEGNDTSLDAGLHHLGSALASIAILVDAQVQGSLIDDRQYGDAKAYQQLLQRLQGDVQRLQKLHADKKPHHWSRQDHGKKA